MLSEPYGRESSIMIVLSMLLQVVVLVKDPLALLKQDKGRPVKKENNMWANGYFETNIVQQMSQI